jgi:hypothetical protein
MGWTRPLEGGRGASSLDPSLLDAGERRRVGFVRTPRTQARRAHTRFEWNRRKTPTGARSRRLTAAGIALGRE